MILWLLVLLLQVPSSVPPRDASPGSSVRGRVLDSITGAPIAGAIVEIHVTGGEALKRVEAAANGEFQLADVPRGAWLAVTPPPLQATHIPRVLQPDLSGESPELVVPLDPALAIDGRVVDESDSPMANVRVMAEPLDVVDTPRASREHFSDDRGMFRLFGLAAGPYRICAVPERRGGSSYAKTCHPTEGATVRAIELRHGVASPIVTIAVRRSRPSPVQQPSAETDNRVEIRGRVSDEKSRARLPGALVSLAPPSGGEPYEAFADERGQFEIRVPPGPYDMRATAGEFKSTHAASRSELLIMPGDPPGELEINLTRAGTASGTVLKDRDTPLADVVVELVPQGAEMPILFDHPPMTNDRGQFRAHGIPPGRYTVCARPRTSRQAAAGDWMYARGCLPGSVSLTSETGLSPIRLERLGTYSISGRIVGSGGDVPAGTSATLIGDAMSRMTTMRVADDGSFVFARLVPGIYEVAAFTILKGPRQFGVAAQWAGIRVEILDGDVPDVVLQLSEGASVRGRVTIDDPGNDRSLRGIEVRAVPVGVGAQVPAPTPVETDEDGAFVLRGVFGTRVVRLRTPQGYAVRSIRYAGRDITDVPTSFDGDSAASVEILLSQSNAELIGRVFDDMGRLAEDAGVLYFPADPARWKAYEGGLRQQSLGGRYRIDRITGGDYLVIAVRGPRPGWTETDYLVLAPFAERVTLQDGERRVLDLRVVTLGR